MEHVSCVVPVVVAERVLIDVALEVLPADGVVDAHDAVLEKAPEPFDRVRVDVPLHIDARPVVDAVVRVTLLGEALVLVGLVGEDRRRGHHMLND